MHTTIYIVHTTDLCNRKTKAFSAPILNFAFVLPYLFEGTSRICKMMISKISLGSKHSYCDRGEGYKRDAVISTNLSLMVSKI